MYLSLTPCRFYAPRWQRHREEDETDREKERRPAAQRQHPLECSAPTLGGTNTHPTQRAVGRGDAVGCCAVSERSHSASPRSGTGRLVSLIALLGGWVPVRFDQVDAYDLRAREVVGSGHGHGPGDVECRFDFRKERVRRCRVREVPQG